MNHPIVESSEGVTLVAGGPVSARDLAFARARAPRLVAADGGADRAIARGHLPEAVIGDFDSVSDAARAAVGPAGLHPIAEQDSTDFDKALRSIAAPFVLALGVAGARIDHGLAVMNVLVQRRERVCLLIGPEDVVFHAPPELTLRMGVGERVSLFPFLPVTGQSEGLRWAINGLNLAPGGQTSTSNEAAAREVRLRFDGPGMLVLLPRKRLDAALNALLAPGWRPAQPWRGGSSARGG
ncbi:thiamine diphosphokinase [Fertoebacter nigrum]|uniref:Thiamine diphosphokinase n=1 Tax=Fertoeibacter niger TaxID=2656921 RepID=A0A8X8H0R6_9RHOB|nr:thiamine diphosphokinase [Fertoeibacter niger]NUB44099.1 thiamine diphosphokinase [Fertoeibacter niger]